MKTKKKRTKQDLIDEIIKAADDCELDGDAKSLRKVAKLLQESEWKKAHDFADNMDTMVREEIPNWGWKMMDSMIRAVAYIARVDGKNMEILYK